jgi:5-methylthioadenosine/S-adenosylhomocysteine deaminase
LAVIEREQARLTDEQAYVGALATYAEALLSGTTTLVDMCIRPEPALAAARDIGIRAVIVPYVADTKPFAPTLEHNAHLLKGADDTKGRVRVWVGLHDLESCSDDSIRTGAALARAYGTGLHLHCSETRISVERTRSRVGRTPVAHLLELGALDDRTLLAHCVGLRRRTARCSRAPGRMSPIVRTLISSSGPPSLPSPTCACAA